MPRPDMIIVPHDATVTAALDLAIAHGYSRLPLQGEDPDDIVGLIYTKDLIRAERSGERRHARPPSCAGRSASSPRTSRSPG